MHSLKSKLKDEIEKKSISVIVKEDELFSEFLGSFSSNFFNVGQFFYAAAMSKKAPLALVRFEDLILIRHFLNKIFLAQKPAVLIAVYNDMLTKRPFTVPFFELTSFFHYPPSINIWPKDIFELSHYLNKAFDIAASYSLPITILVPESTYLGLTNHDFTIDIKPPKTLSFDRLKFENSDFEMGAEEKIYERAEKESAFEYEPNDSETLVVANGPLYPKLKSALAVLPKHKQPDMFRPINISPFPKKKLALKLGKIKNICLFDHIIPYMTLVENGLSKNPELFIRRETLPKDINQITLEKIVSYFK